MLQFTQRFYQFEVQSDAKVGDVVGRVWLMTADSRSTVVYFLRPQHRHFDVNQTTGIIYVIKDLSEWTDARRRRRSVQVSGLSRNIAARRLTQSLTQQIDLTQQHRRNTVIHWQQRVTTSNTNHFSESAALRRPTRSRITGDQTDRDDVLQPGTDRDDVLQRGVSTADRLRPTGKKQSDDASMDEQTTAVTGRRRRSVESVQLTVVAQSGEFEAEVTVQLAVNLTACCGTAHHTTGSPTLAGTPLILLIVLLGLAIIVAGVITIVCLRRRRSKSALGGLDQGVDSTGADSSSLETFDVPLPPPPAYAEDMRRRRYHAAAAGLTDPELDDDDYTGGCESSGRGSAEKPSVLTQWAADHEIQMINCGDAGSRAVAGPRALAQPDSGIQPDHEDAASTASGDVQRGRVVKLAGASSVDSMHQFYDEGGGEASVRLSAADNSPPSCFDEPVIDADQLLLLAADSRYSVADYLLNWRPEYQPLADVFAEIARLPDDSHTPGSCRPLAPKTCPTHIVPQTANHRLGSAPTAQRGPRPPPIITAAPPRAVRVAMATGDNDSVTSSMRSSTSSNHVELQQQQPASRDLTGSVSYSSPERVPAIRTSCSRASDREIHI